MLYFEGMPKIPRLSRECFITEKIDGTNAQLFIGDVAAGEPEFLVGSRTRIITPKADNFGFAAWAYEHKDELIEGLGHGRHFGEWWGQGIQRNYGLKERRFSLFNVGRWHQHGEMPRTYPKANPMVAPDVTQEAPECCHVVPIMFHGKFTTTEVDWCIIDLKERGSCAVHDYMNPEGVVVYHVAARQMFKKTVERDEEPKGKR